MCEILVKAVDASHADPIRDQSGCYKRGMPVVIMPDGHPWGREEVPPKFAVLRLPGVSADRVLKYIEPHTQTAGVDRDGNPISKTVRRRKWIIRLDAMPAAHREKIAQSGRLTIASGLYAGAHDATWAQARGYFRNQATGLDEDQDIAAVAASARIG